MVSAPAVSVSGNFKRRQSHRAFVLYGFSMCGDESRSFWGKIVGTPFWCQRNTPEFPRRVECLIPGLLRREKEEGGEEEGGKKPLRSPHFVFWQQGKSARFSCEDLVMC